MIERLLGWIRCKMGNHVVYYDMGISMSRLLDDNNGKRQSAAIWMGPCWRCKKLLVRDATSVARDNACREG